MFKTRRVKPDVAIRGNDQEVEIFYNTDRGTHVYLHLDEAEYAVGGGNLPFGTATGTNTYVVALSPRASGVNRTINVKFTNTNTGAATLNVDGAGAIAIQTADGAALTSGQIPAGTVMQLVLDTTYKLLGVLSGGG